MSAAIGGYLKRPYHVEIVTSESEDGDSGWVAEVRELKGCIAQGRTRDELFENIERAMTERPTARCPAGGRSDTGSGTVG